MPPTDAPVKKSYPTFRSRPTNSYSPSGPDLKVHLPTTMAEKHKLKYTNPRSLRKPHGITAKSSGYMPLFFSGA